MIKPEKTINGTKWIETIQIREAAGRTCPAPTYTTIHAALLLQNKPPPRCGACGPHRGGGCGVQTALKKIVAFEIVDA